MSETEILLMKVLVTCLLQLFMTMVTFSFLMHDLKASWRHDGLDGFIPLVLLVFAFFWPVVLCWGALKLMWRVADDLGKLISRD